MAQSLPWMARKKRAGRKGNFCDEAKMAKTAVQRRLAFSDNRPEYTYSTSKRLICKILALKVKRMVRQKGHLTAPGCGYIVYPR
jgi:hypothetical protein